MPESPDAQSRSPFEYAIVRVVPRVERGEAFNAGIVLMCRPRRYLGARAELDENVLVAMAPDCDPEIVREHLAAIEAIAAGDPDAGPIAALSAPERFHWLVCSVVDDHRHVRGPHRVDRGSSSDPRAPVPDPRPPLSRTGVQEGSVADLAPHAHRCHAGRELAVAGSTA